MDKELAFSSDVTKSSFVIAPSNAVNKEHADLILTGINDAVAINTALAGLASPTVSVIASVTGTGSTTTVIKMTPAYGSLINDLYNGCTMTITLPTGTESRMITDYSPDTVTVSPSFSSAPASGVPYTIKANVPVRVDFLGGDITVDTTISVPNNFNVYGNKVVLTQGAVMASSVISGGICNIDGIVVGDVSIIGISVIIGNVTNCIGAVSGEGVGINVTTGNVSNCTISAVGGGGSYGINVTTGNVSNCTFGAISGAGTAGISVATGNVSNCTFGDISGTGVNGVKVTTGKVSNCTVGNISSSTGIFVTTGNVLNCKVGNGSGMGATSIHVSVGNISNCTVGIVSSYGWGIETTTGSVSNCAVGAVGGSFPIGIHVTNGNVSNCEVGTVTGGTGIYVDDGVNNVISGNKILSGDGSNVKGIYVNGSACIVTNNNVGTATNSFIAISILGTLTHMQSNYYNVSGSAGDLQ